MSNFKFLENEQIYSSFSTACIEAENSMSVSYGTATIMSRRALELAVKWLYSYDDDLQLPYNDKLSALINNYSFLDIIDSSLPKQLKYIQNLGNKAVHTPIKVRKDEAILSLRNLFNFVSWIDYCYSKEVSNTKFDESKISDNEGQVIKKKDLQELSEKLDVKDRKLADVIKENQELREKYKLQREINVKTRTFEAEDFSEWETRKKYIDLEIELNGYTIGNDCEEEFEVSGMPTKSGKGYIDYVLKDASGVPIAVVEAKKTSVDPKAGKKQAELYANCIEKQYNRRPIIFYTNGFEYYIWDDTEYPERQMSGLYAKTDLEKLVFRRKNKKPLNDLQINDNISSRYYQKSAIQAVCETFSRKRQRALLVMATGSGKTRTAISIVDVLQRKGWIKNILFLADRVELVKQAKNNFSNLLPSLTIGKLDDSNVKPDGRMIFSTYPTMMNAIDDVKGQKDLRIFTKGHFDLIILDESHRSIYKKYSAIFDYFDAKLLGLTATPKSDIEKNTYRIFDLESGVPTYAYDLETAVADKFLVPYKYFETTTKFIDKGIVYNELSKEDKELFEEQFDGDTFDISSDEINSFLFNEDTIDKVIFDLMEKGYKVDSGDKLGKTIIFAKNQHHADFIVERFDKLYPHYAGKFCASIHNKVKYYDKIISDFSTSNKFPQIAVSVDMLDTGIDIPEIVNLVFFKKVRSKAKFWQMIGRGTRLCENLYGDGQHKDGFLIFDTCQNFKYFGENPEGVELGLIKSLSERLFNVKVSVVKELSKLDYQEKPYTEYREELVKDIVASIQNIDENKFTSELNIKYIHKYNSIESFNDLKDSDLTSLNENIASLVKPTNDDINARRFDYIMYHIELDYLLGDSSSRKVNRVVYTAKQLEELGTIKKVQDQKQLIRKVQTKEFWDNATVSDCENVRKYLRELIKYITTPPTLPEYTSLNDELFESSLKESDLQFDEFKSYRMKVKHYLEEHIDDDVIMKLRLLEKLDEDDISHLEQVLWKELGSKEEYEITYGKEPLKNIILSVVGVDKVGANNHFSKFLSDQTLNAEQRDFVKMIIDHVSSNGMINKQLFNEFPFNKNGNIADLFDGKMEVARDIITKVDEINTYLSS